MKFIITKSNDTGYKDLASKIESDLQEKGYCKLKVMDDKRGLDANAIQHVWLSQIAHETGQDVQTVEAINKIRAGLPVALQGDMGRDIAWTLSKIDFWNMDESQQIRWIKQLPVTSILSPKEHTMMRDNMRTYWEQETGVILQYQG